MGLSFLQHPLEMILIYVFLVLSFGMHEAAHAKVAVRFGDTQPIEDGMNSWNPITHIRRSIFSSLIIPAITWFLFGFFIGGAFTRLNPANMKPRRFGHALASAAGPAMNLGLSIVSGLLAVLFAFITKKPVSSSVIVMVVVGSFNFFGFVFNLLPIPPLDGSSIIRALFPATESFFRLLQGFPILLIFIITMQFSAVAQIIFLPVKLYTDAVGSIISSIVH